MTEPFFGIVIGFVCKMYIIMDDAIFKILKEVNEWKEKFEKDFFQSAKSEKINLEEENRLLKEQVQLLKDQLNDKNEIIKMLKEQLKHS